MAYVWPTTSSYIQELVVGGSSYFLKDKDARDAIDKLSSYTEFLGVTTTNVKTSTTANPVTIGGQQVTAKKGDIVIYEAGEFIWDGSAWAEFGDLSGIYDQLGDLAFNDEASASYTPAGTISVSGDFTGKEATITVSGSTTGSITVASDSATGNYTPAGSVSVVLDPATLNVVNSATQGTLPTFEASLLTATVSSETLTFSLEANGFNQGTLPTFTTSSVLNGVTVSTATFSGQTADITYSSAAIELIGTYTPELSTVPTYSFVGSSATITVTGSVSKPTT